MIYPLNNNIDPTFDDLYKELYLYDDLDEDGEGYFLKIAKKSFPSILSEEDAFYVIIRVLAWAVARSYQQPIILKYVYDPDLVMNVLLPRLADTLDFKTPLEYPLEELRLIIKYLQKIRRTRGTFSSIKKLVRILNITRREILEMDWDVYGSVDVMESDFDGVIFVQYNHIEDFKFVQYMLKYVVPAGYLYRIESGLDTWEITDVVRNRVEFGYFKEFTNLDKHEVMYEYSEGTEFAIPLKFEDWEGYQQWLRLRSAT